MSTNVGFKESMEMIHDFYEEMRRYIEENGTSELEDYRVNEAIESLIKGENLLLQSIANAKFLSFFLKNGLPMYGKEVDPRIALISDNLQSFSYSCEFAYMEYSKAIALLQTEWSNDPEKYDVPEKPEKE